MLIWRMRLLKCKAVRDIYDIAFERHYIIMTIIKAKVLLRYILLMNKIFL